MAEPRDSGALMTEEILGVGPAIVFLAHEIIHGHLDVFEPDFVDFGAAIERANGPHGDPGLAHVEQHHRDAPLGLGLGIRAHQAEHPVGMLRHGRPGLLAIDDVVIPDALRTGVERGQIRA